jgi:hypothetical protein
VLVERETSEGVQTGSGMRIRARAVNLRTDSGERSSERPLKGTDGQWKEEKRESGEGVWTGRGKRSSEGPVKCYRGTEEGGVVRYL